jgi:pyruvate dehydrogenase E1 component alpha subunit
MLLRMYELMRIIRTYEETLSTLFAAGEIPGFVHLYAGQEAVAVGVMTALKEDDFITSTHRGHGHCIAKGLDIQSMLAENFGRATGVCKGKGGSMHIADIGKGMLGANGIVAAGCPLAAGAGLSAKVRGTKQVCVSFFGDGATNQGMFHEAINLASVWDLPVIFVCENNGYAQTTSVEYAIPVETIAERTAAYGIPGVTVDGQNVVEVHAAAAEAVGRARSGEGPTLIEAKTYRYFGHFQGDPVNYRPEGEADEFHRRDPLKVFAEHLASPAGITPDDIKAIDQTVETRMDQALEYARSSPLPEPADTLNDAYVSY